MAGPKKKPTKHVDQEQKKTSENASKKTNITDAFLKSLKGAFDDFNDISESKRAELYGNKEYLEQFREYFQKEHPGLLDKVNKKDLPLFIKSIENKGFSIENIKKNAGKLNDIFKPEDTELHVMTKSLDELKTFCDNDENKVPTNTFKKFASYAGFNDATLEPDSDGKIRNMDDLYPLRKEFVKKEDIKLKSSATDHIQKLLIPSYNPMERIMVNIAITKIRGQLTGSLKAAFDKKFPLPITVFSSYQDLLGFQSDRAQFLIDHQTEIDEPLAKKLDAIIVTNGDIQNTLFDMGKKFDNTKGFTEREQSFRRIFNKFVTRQLFEEMHETQRTVDHYIDAMANTFREFPPYVNEIIKIYPFNDMEISAIDTAFHADLQSIDMQISTTQDASIKGTEEERTAAKKKLKQLKQEREQRKRQAYVAFLRSKEPPLADVFAALVASKFNFSMLSPDQQQLLIDTLLKHKIQDTIKNKIPDLLAVDEADLTQFVNDLFDLKKMEVSIPTRYGPIPLTFLKKEFMATEHKTLPNIDNLHSLKNLPLNFVTQLTESNTSFFEDSVIFASLFSPFAAKNGTFKINDAYKVKITKDSKPPIEGYLSPYSPIDEYNTDRDGKELYLYSHPVTAPNQERKLVTRDDGTPVVIKDSEQGECAVDIIDKTINLNGEALGALLFGYVLGQESMATSMPLDKEKELGEKLGKLNVYKEKDEDKDEAEEVSSGDQSKPTEKVDDAEEKKFTNEREQLAGYGFPEEKYKENGGFVEGTRLFVPFMDSVMPPLSGNIWMDMKIINIDRKKGTFTLKLYGCETRLGKYEGVEKTVPINTSSLDDIKKHFGGKIYKLPDVSKNSFNDWMNIMQSSNVVDGIDKSFSKLKFSGGKFSFSLGEEVGADVEHFGRYEPNIGEGADEEAGRWALYKIKHNSNNTFTVTSDFDDGKGGTKKYSRDMDYPTFLIFISGKGLQPKSKKQSENIKKNELEDKETPTTVRGFSIGNVLGFFKNSITRLKDGIKKFDEERTEDLTDALTDEGRLYGRIGSILPFTRMASSFESTGAEYFLARDDRIRKKIEKWTKFYEDQHFATIYDLYLKPLLQGTVTPTPHYKIAALLLTMIKKGKGPYNRNAEMVGTGTWINILMGKEHQQRYLAMRDKRLRELSQNSASYPTTWTDQVRNELVELEMKYIVHTIDGRQLGAGPEVEKALVSKRSRKFAGELEGAYTEFFKQDTVEGGYNKIPKTTNFEFARFEYFRLIKERPQQAIPYLKVMAEKAYTTSQRETFEHAVMAGILSGIFLNMTFSDTTSFIQKVCRTRGFLPGLWVRDFNQQSKLAKLLSVISDGSFDGISYKPSDFSFGNMKGIKGEGGTGSLINRDMNDPKKHGALKKRFDEGNNLHMVSEFLQFTGKAKNGKTLVEMHADPNTSPDVKMLLGEIINKSLEKDEEIDPNVKYNPGSLKTSVFTKSQSVVQELMKCKNGVFDGKDKDENHSMQSFRKEVSNKLPTTKLSKENVSYYLKKFLNWFEERGLTGNNRSIFVRRLQTVNALIASHREKEAMDILRYTVVGNVIKGLHTSIPEELKSGLEAFMTFFKTNLDTILDPIMVKNVFGPQYVDDSQKSYKFAERFDYIDTLPQNAGFMGGIEGKEINHLRKRYNGIEYINKELYRLADDLFKNSGEPNRFNNYYTSEKKTDTLRNAPKPTRATGTKIKNPEIIDKVRRILENKPLDNESNGGYPMPVNDDGDFDPSMYDM